MSDNTNNLVKKISKEPFYDDCLNREPFVKKVSNILINSKGKDVFSLEASFGAGKTVLNHRLKSYIENNKQFKTKCIYVNVWESDFYNSPLIPIIDEISNSFKTWRGEATKIAVKKLKDSGKELLKKSLWQGGKVLANSVVSGAGGVAVDLIKNGVENINLEIEEQEEVYNEYRELKKLKSNFIDSLSELSKKRKLVIIIDELDRCRPDYAIETLEVIKHFFEAKNVTFLLSINKEQLASSVRCIYGLEHKCFDDCLRKFVDFAIKLPDPNNKGFSRYLFNSSSLKSLENKSIFFAGKNRDRKEFSFVVSKIFEIMSDAYDVSLRIQEQIFSKLDVLVSSLGKNEYFMPELHIPLLFVSDRASDDYKDLKKGNHHKVTSKVKYGEHLMQHIAWSRFGSDRIDVKFFPFAELLNYRSMMNDNTKLNNNKFLEYNHDLFNFNNDIENAFNKIEFIEEITSQ
jgi:hypothetical protein